MDDGPDTTDPAPGRQHKDSQALPQRSQAEAGELYADTRHQLTSTGQQIGELDMMIAAHALALGATLVTTDTRRYERIQAQLLLENWAK